MIWETLGGLFLLKCLLSLKYFLSVMKVYVLPIFGIKCNLKKYGSWAVVTGATDGIGKAVAIELAKSRGLNVVLISRTQEKLDEVAKEIESFGVKAKTLQFDFSQNNAYDKLKEELKDLDIGLLVNNVGKSLDHPDFYLHYDSKEYNTLINLNIISVLEMTRIVLSGMIDRSKGGVIVNMSSSSSFVPHPLLNVYSASKVFVNHFSQSLAYEYKKNSIKSQVVTPYFVATKLSKMRASGILVPSASAFAKQMVKAIGLSDVMCGYWSHDVLYFILSCLPEWFVVNKAFQMLDGTRRRWVKKMEKKST